MQVQQHSPTLAGFKTVFSRPSLGLAEIAWRWSFGFATALLLTFSVIEYLDSLPVTHRDELLFRTRQPALISRALAQILRGSSLRVIAVGVLLAIALSIAWILLSSLGRAATLRAIGGLSEPHIGRPSLRPLVGLNFLRAAVSLAAVVGCVSVFLAARSPSSSTESASGDGFVLFFLIALMVALVWVMLNWFLSLATIYATVEGCGTFDAIVSAVGLCRDRIGPILAVGIWFGLAHIVVFVVATSIVGFPMVLAGVVPASVVLGGVLLVALLYFAAVDFLYVGRVAAYLSILKIPQTVPAVESISIESTADIDRNELILSDLPNLVPET